MIEKKINGIVYANFTVIDPTTGEPAPYDTITYFLYVGAGLSPQPAPSVSTGQRKDTLGAGIVGAYVASFSVADPYFAVGSTYSLWALITIGGILFPVPVVELLVRSYDVDDVGADTALLGGTVTWRSPYDTTNSTLTLWWHDDYTVTSGQWIEFEATGFDVFPVDSVKMKFSHETTERLVLDCETEVIDAETQRVKAYVTAAVLQAALTYGENHVHRTYRNDTNITIDGGKLVLKRIGA